ncbi:Na+/H+ antiporter NhaA [Foetidibacter luteolus]|uniref:Na+/H+ antiporter NhaA n=1 Tax=Foetidibacter luteolus TaxID=2608880 RepID=UPI00129B6539|nr:Na+/H+ antiporter NhaA [Foetidibacter luteolus]
MPFKIFSFFKHQFLDPLNEFIHDSRSIGIMLLLCTAISLVVTNLPGGERYIHFWETEFHFLHNFYLPHTLLHFINDGLMAVFFFLAGMEIKRELLEGELNSLRKATLPVVAAIGGMLVPAVIYSIFNKGTIFQSGWGIPTATDIAFSLGVASLLGSRVPVTLKIFLTALAIIDDLGAIIVIALFYGAEVNIAWLIACAVTGFLIWLVNKKMAFGWLQFVLGILMWYCMFNSGIHATVAGVLFAFLVPQKCLHHFEMKLHSIVYFIIMPIFALANTAILLPANAIVQLGSTLSVGIILGLFIGKPLGIYAASYFVIKKRIAKLPQGTTLQHLLGGGMLAGIGFTMSIFIATLAFTDVSSQNMAKVAVLAGSIASIIAGYAWLMWVSRKNGAGTPQQH